MGEENQEFVIRVRGLPWTCTVDQIITFFEPIEIKGGADGVHITKSREGRPNGEAFIEFENAEDMAEAEKKHNEHIGRRYIEVFPAQKSELDWVVKREFTGSDDEDDCCVRLRGLPFNCSKEEIYQFFSGLEIVPNGIAMATDFQGRTTGEAFVQFVSKKMADKAQELHKEKIGHRYIEIFPSNLEQIRAAMSGRGGGGGMRGGAPPFIGPQAGPFGDDDDGPSFNNMNFNNGGGPMGGGGGFNNRSTPYDARDRMGGPNRFNRGFNDFDGGNMGGGWGGGRGRGGARSSRPRYPTNSVHMRGLPFKASDYDIMEFFKPLSTVNITLGTDNNGRASGEADVEFGSHEDAVKAMEKHKSNMKHRYIELFLNSSPKEEEFPRGRGGFDMGGDGDMNNMGGGGGMMGNMGGGGGMMGNMGGGFDNMGWNQSNMGWQQQQGNMGWGSGGNMGGWGGGGGNMGGMGGGMGMGGMGGSGNMGMGSGGNMGGNMGGMGGNMGGMGGNMGGMGGNMGGMGGNMGGMGGNMGGMSGNMGGMGGNMGGMGGNMSGMGNMGGFGGGNGNMGGGMGMGSGGAGMGSMEKMGRNMSGGSGAAGMKGGDSFGGKIKPTGRGGSWSTDGDRKTPGYGGAIGGTRGYGAGGDMYKNDGKKEIKSSVIESRSGADYSGGAGYGAGSVPGTMDFKGDGFGYGAGKGTGTGGYNMQGSSVASGGAGPVYDYGRNNNGNSFAGVGARGADYSGSSSGAIQGAGYDGSYGSGGAERGTGAASGGGYGGASGGGYGGASGGVWQSGTTGTENAGGASSGSYGGGDYQSRAGMANYSYT